MKNEKGFSLIELLIVVVVIGIIAAIAIPNLLASRRASNEASAISSLRTYHSAQMTYQGSAGAGNYAGDSLTNSFGVLGQARIIDEVLGSGIKSGYSFEGHATPASNGIPATFYGMATPVSPLAANTNSGGGPVFAAIMFRATFLEMVGSSVTATGTRKFAAATNGVIYYQTTANSYQLYRQPMYVPYDDITGYQVSGGTNLENTESSEEVFINVS